MSLCRYFKYLRRLRVFETLASAVNVRYEGDIRAIARSSSQGKSCSPISAVALFATRQPQKRARKLLTRLSFFLPRPPRLVSSPFVSDRVGCLVSCVRLYISLVELPPPRLRLVLYVFLKVNKPDAIANLLAENFLRKYARVRHSLEPLDTRRSRLSPLSFPFGQGLLIERNMLKLVTLASNRGRENFDIIKVVNARIRYLGK